MSGAKEPAASNLVDNTSDVENDSHDIKEMLRQFIAASTSFREADRLQHQREISDLRSSIDVLKARDSPSYPIQTPFPDRREGNRRSSMFFGTPSNNKSDTNERPQIQVLQTDIIYDRERDLKVSSLEGLQYLAKQIALLSTKYPNREIKIANMVAYNLRPHIVAAWNSFCHKEFLISGVEFTEVITEQWLSLSNDSVQAMLLESARPRTKELYARELVLFIGRTIPQSPDINSDNFNKIFYVPLMKSLNNLINLHDLLSEETSNHSNNLSKMPSVTYGTRDSPGHIALWVISLGSQKDAILQWLGKDILSKHATVEQSVKYIRSKLMEGRTQSEVRQDFEAKLTPIRYEDIRHTQGESFQRQQIRHPSRSSISTPQNGRYRDATSRPSFAAIHTTSPCDETTHNTCHDYADDYEDDTYDDSNDDVFSQQADEDDSDNTNSQQQNRDNFDSLNAAIDNNFRSALGSTFRGFCSELFVFGKCSKKDSGCSFDHSSSGQEKCIQSFNLLAKRELLTHSQLPQWHTPPSDSTVKKAIYSQSRFPKSNSPPFSQPRSYSSPPATYHNGFHSKQATQNSPHGGPSVFRAYNK